MQALKIKDDVNNTQSSKIFVPFSHLPPNLKSLFSACVNPLWTSWHEKINKEHYSNNVIVNLPELKLIRRVAKNMRRRQRSRALIAEAQMLVDKKMKDNFNNDASNEDEKEMSEIENMDIDFIPLSPFFNDSLFERKMTSSIVFQDSGIITNEVAKMDIYAKMRILDREFASLNKMDEIIFDRMERETELEEHKSKIFIPLAQLPAELKSMHLACVGPLWASWHEKINKEYYSNRLLVDLPTFKLMRRVANLGHPVEVGGGGDAGLSLPPQEEDMEASSSSSEEQNIQKKKKIETLSNIPRKIKKVRFADEIEQNQDNNQCPHLDSHQSLFGFDINNVGPSSPFGSGFHGLGNKGLNQMASDQPSPASSSTSNNNPLTPPLAPDGPHFKFGVDIGSFTAPRGGTPVLISRDPNVTFIPPLYTLSQMVRGSECVVNNFIIDHSEFGSLTIFGEFNIMGVDIDKLVKFEQGKITMLPQRRIENLGEGMSRKVRMTLKNIWPLNPITNELVKDPLNTQLLNYWQILKRKSERQGLNFIGYNHFNGIWMFEFDPRPMNIEGDDYFRFGGSQ